MATHLIPEKFCTHDGSIVMTESEVRCGECHSPMIWVTRAHLESLRREPSEVERELHRQLAVKTAALHRIRQYLVEVGIE